MKLGSFQLSRGPGSGHYQIEGGVFLITSLVEFDAAPLAMVLRFIYYRMFYHGFSISY